MAGIKRSTKESPPIEMTCTACGQVKPFTSEFFKPGKWRAWGLTKECRKCLNARELKRRRDNPKAQETIAQWKEKNIERVRVYARNTARRRYQKHKEYLAKWRARNPHKSNEYYVKAAERLKPIRSAWRKANADKTRSYTANYQAKKRGAGGSHSSNDIKRIGAAQRWKCAACGISVRLNFHVDHIEPISKGGSNAPSNLQLLCGTCNRRKADKEPERFMRELGFLL